MNDYYPLGFDWWVIAVIALAVLAAVWLRRLTRRSVL